MNYQDPFRRIDVSAWEPSRVEAEGSSPVTWLVEPETQVWWLHKNAERKTWGFQGEDWAEVVSTQVGLALGVPCAATLLCTRGGTRGSLSRSLLALNSDRAHATSYDFYEGGGILADAQAPGYYRNLEGDRALDPTRPEVRRPGHNLANIRDVLANVLPPLGFEGPSTATGFEVFAGMLLFDAIVANTDRHEQNWAVLRARTAGQRDRLAASFDHGNTLGYNLREEKKASLLETEQNLRAYAERGLAQRFEHQAQPPTLVALAAEAWAMCGPAMQGWWRTRLEGLDATPILEELARIPELSELGSRFIARLLDVNVRRLRDALERS